MFWIDFGFGVFVGAVCALCAVLFALNYLDKKTIGKRGY